MVLTSKAFLGLTKIWTYDIFTYGFWRGVRAVEGSGLENQRRETYRGFESHPLRFFYLER